METGFLGYADLFYKPDMGLFGANLRLQYFETEVMIAVYTLLKMICCLVMCFRHFMRRASATT
jgi:hypothetical protein